MTNVAFYPCCRRDISEPSALLSGISDRIVFCDIDPILRDARETWSHWPKRTFWRYDAWRAIDDMPRIDVLFYRRDSAEGSRFFVFGKFVFPKILAKMKAKVSLIITDGSNSRGGTIRKMKRPNGLIIEGKHISKRSIQRFEKYGLTEYEVINLNYSAYDDLESQRDSEDFDWSDRLVIPHRPKQHARAHGLSPVIKSFAMDALRMHASRAGMPKEITDWPNGLFDLMFEEWSHREETAESLLENFELLRVAGPSFRNKAMGIIYRVLVRAWLDGDSISAADAVDKIDALVEVWRKDASEKERWILDHQQSELDWFRINAKNARYWEEGFDHSIRNTMDSYGIPQEERDEWLGLGNG